MGWIGALAFCLCFTTGCDSSDELETTSLGKLRLPLISKKLSRDEIQNAIVNIDIVPKGCRAIQKEDKKALLLFVGQLCAVVASVEESDVFFPVTSETWKILEENFPALQRLRNDERVINDGRVSMKQLWPHLFELYNKI